MNVKLFFLALIVIVSCIACNDDNKSSTNCADKEEWQGFDEECGCYGDSKYGFSNICLTFFEGDVQYFGYGNYGNVKDSIMVVYNTISDQFSVVTISDIPSIDDKGGKLVSWYIDNNREIRLMYDDTHWNNPEALGEATELRLDPNELISQPEVLKVKLYQREFFSFSSTILDSTTIEVVKDLNRK